MSEFDAVNCVTLIILGIAGAVGGYILRRLEKFEEQSDDFRATSLTQISSCGSLILETITRFSEDHIEKDDLVSIFDSVEACLKKQIFELSGVALLSDEKRKRITEFYFKFLMFSKSAKKYNDANLKTKLTQTGQTLGNITLSQLKETIQNVQTDLKNELAYYRWKLPILMVILISILAVSSAIITYVEGIITGA